MGRTEGNEAGQGHQHYAAQPPPPPQQHYSPHQQPHPRQQHYPPSPPPQTQHYPPPPQQQHYPTHPPQYQDAKQPVSAPPYNGDPIQTPSIGKPWSTGLFDCQENETNAVMTAFLPCVTFGQVSEILDEGELTCPVGSFIYLLMMPALCSHWVMGSKYRTKLRNNYGLVEAPYGDVASHVFCPCCSLCQEFRELQKRGLDPGLGWNGILAQRGGMQYQPGQGNVPPAYQGMHK